MRKIIALTMALLLAGTLALADVPQLSDKLFDSAKRAVAMLASGEYERLVTDLPYSDVAPNAAEWERFARNFSSLAGYQTQYAVAYWRGGGWAVAVPIHAPDNGGVEVLVLNSGNGSSFNGYRYATWGTVQAEYSGCEYIRWNQEYMGGGATLMADTY